MQQRRKPQARSAQQIQIARPAQRSPQQHEQPELPLPDDTAKQIEQYGGGQGEKQEQGDARNAAADRRHEQVIEKAQHQPAAQAAQRLEALCGGVDPHQPSSLPKKPRLLPPFSAYSSASICPSTSSSPPSRFSRFSLSPLPRTVS